MKKIKTILLIILLMPIIVFSENPKTSLEDYSASLRYDEYIVGDDISLEKKEDGFSCGIFNDKGAIHKDYSVYIDKYGWKTLRIDNEIIKIIERPKKDASSICFYKDWNIMDLDFREENRLIYNITASSELIEGKTIYRAAGIINNYESFGPSWKWHKNNKPWVEGVEGDGIGEFIEFDVRQKNPGFRIFLEIINGYVDPEKPHLYLANNRIKKATLICDYTDKYEITFNDIIEFKYVYLDKNYKHFKLIIDEVYKGTKYSDTCLTYIGVDYYF